MARLSDAFPFSLPPELSGGAPHQALIAQYTIPLRKKPCLTYETCELITSARMTGRPSRSLNRPSRSSAANWLQDLRKRCPQPLHNARAIPCLEAFAPLHDQLLRSDFASRHYRYRLSAPAAKSSPACDDAQRFPHYSSNREQSCSARGAAIITLQLSKNATSPARLCATSNS